MYESIMINKLSRCPICNRKPKLIHTSGGSVRLECKPWYRRKPHLTTGNVYNKHYCERLAKVAEIWNRKADCANLPVW
jgi:hypothetical protein